MRPSGRAVVVIALVVALVAPACSNDEVSPLCEAVEKTRASFQELTDPATLEGGRDDVTQAADDLAASITELREQADEELGPAFENLQDEIDELQQVVEDTTLSDLGSGEVADQLRAVENAWSSTGEEARAAFGDC